VRHRCIRRPFVLTIQSYSLALPILLCGSDLVVLREALTIEANTFLRPAKFDTETDDEKEKLQQSTKMCP